MKVMPAQEVQTFLEPIASEIGVEIIEVRWNARDNSLTVFIDAENGVDLILCEKFHRAIDGPLDELDPTYGAPYTLNCSSAGLDRPFKTKRDFERRMGEKVEIGLYAPLNGKKHYEGVLKAFDGEIVMIETDGEEERIPFEKTAYVRLLIEV